MKTLFAFLLILTASFSFSQQKVMRKDIYVKKGIAYDNDGKLFTGTVESRQNNGHLVFQEEYMDGYKTKYTQYYNGEGLSVSDEIYYHENSFSKKEEIRYSSDRQQISHKHYDAMGKKTLEEDYENDKLTYSCEYRNGKKHGKKFCVTENCDDLTEYYENGKKIKNK